MMFVIAEKEEASPSPRKLDIPKHHQSPRELDSTKDRPSPRELLSPNDLQSPREFQSPKEYLTPRDTPKYYDEINPNPKEYLTPKAYDTSEISGQFRNSCDDGKDNHKDDEISRGAAADENSEVDGDSDASENDEFSGEEDADGDATKNDEIGGGDADADLVDSLLQEEDRDLDLPVFQEYHNEDNEQEALSIEMKMRKKKSLLEFRCKVEDAILGNYLLGTPSESDDPIEVAMGKEKLRNITLWGIPLLPSKSHLGSDIVLLKFLKAREFKVEEAYEMLRKTVIWRKELNVEGIIEEELDSEDLRRVAYTNSVDKKGHPLCYNLFGPFRDREMYNRVIGTEEKRKQYLRWRVKCMEMAIRKLSFKPGDVDSIVLITDLGNCPGPAMKELRTLSKNLVVLFEDYYPEFVYRNLVVNVPFWCYVSNAVHSKFGSQGTKKRFIFSRPAQSTDTLLKYINAENLPIQHRGLQRQDDQDFTCEDKAKHLVVKPNSVGAVEVPISEVGTTVQWDVTVAGWEVSYKEEFIPLDEGSYKVLIQKDKKLGKCARNFYHIREPGKIALSFQNFTSKKKKVFYRAKCYPTPAMVPISSTN